MSEAKVALVTGASRGIGLAIAKRLASDGAKVILTGRNAETLEAAAGQVEGETFAKAFDVGDLEATKAAIAEIKDEHGSVDILVNNAGLTRDQLLLRMSIDDWRQVMAVDLDGVFNLTQPVAKMMLRKRWGRIISIGSVVGMMGNPGQANYAAAKAALIGFSKSIAKELGGRGITANVVAPGYIETAMTDVLGDAQRDALLGSLAIRRLGHVDDIAAAVAYLASEEAGYVTGTVLNVSGGLYM